MKSKRNTKKIFAEYRVESEFSYQISSDMKLMRPKNSRKAHNSYLK
jgi:hypothetical protein